MGIISEVKCGRCDRRYSALRGRCPYCGARRNKRGKHVEETDNSRAKLVVGALLILILIVAIVVLVATSISNDRKANKDEDTKKEDIPKTDIDGDITNIGDDTDSKVPDATVPDTTEPEEPDVPEEPPAPTVDSLMILYNGGERTDITMQVGDVLDLDYEIMPEDSKEKVTWSSSDEDVIVVLQTGEVTAIGSGTANLVISAGDVKAECIVRVP